MGKDLLLRVSFLGPDGQFFFRMVKLAKIFTFLLFTPKSRKTLHLLHKFGVNT